MEQTILTDSQVRALDFFKKHEVLSSIFYLTGGTALSEIYLHHRHSEDLDFFTNEKEFPQLEVESFAKELANLLGLKGAEYRRLYDRRIFLFPIHGGELKIEFTYYPFTTIHKPKNIAGVYIDSLEDISANKIMALSDRTEAKDFVDLYFIIKECEISVLKLRELVHQKFQMIFSPIALGSEFAKVRNIEALPNMIKPITIEELKAFFTDQASKLKPEILE